MIELDLNTLTEKKRGAMLTATIAPRPVAFVTTLNTDGSINAAPFSFFNAVSYKPAMLMISVLKVDGKSKDTAINILREKEFVVHTVTEDNVLLVNETSLRLEYGDSELRLADFTVTESKLIKTPGLKEAKVRFEVKLTDHIETEGSNIFIGEVLLMHLATDVFVDNYIDYNKFKPVGRLVGDNFIETKDIKVIKRPV